MSNDLCVSRDYVFDDINDELVRQQEKWGVQNHPGITPAVRAIGLIEQARRQLRDEEARAKRACENDAQLGATNWLNILYEEFCEAAHQASLGEFSEALRDELIQVAAVAVSWIECIDRENAK